jgi:hypothetical protein
MTKKDAKALTKGAIVYDKAHGFPFEFVRLCPYWKGFLSSAELGNRNPDGYELLLKPIENQDYFGLYKFEHHYTFGRGISIDSKKMKKEI